MTSLLEKALLLLVTAVLLRAPKFPEPQGCPELSLHFYCSVSISDINALTFFSILVLNSDF